MIYLCSHELQCPVSQARPVQLQQSSVPQQVRNILLAERAQSAERQRTKRDEERKEVGRGGEEGGEEGEEEERSVSRWWMRGGFETPV